MEEEMGSLNNEGLQLAQEGKFQQAASIFTKLLTHSRTILSRCTVTKQQEEHAHFHTRWLFFTGDPLPVMPSTSCTFIFNKAFKVVSLPPKGVAHSYFKAYKQNATDASMNNNNNLALEFDNDEASILVFTACVIYNLAIVHHNLGLSSLNSKTTTNKVVTKYLNAAEKLYRMCLKILESFDTEDRSTSDNTSGLKPWKTIHLLKVISYNNLAQLYLEQGVDPHDKEGQANNCLHNLYHFMCLSASFFPNRNDQEAGGLFLNEEDYNGIVGNILLLIQLPTTAAAA